VERSIDGGAWQMLDPSATESTFSALVDGGHSISIKVTDSAGNMMTATVSIVIDTMAPTITSKSPLGTGVPINATVAMTFSEAMDESSVLVTGVTGTISWSERTLSLDPAANLAYGSTYVIAIAGHDLAGNQIAYSWEFTAIGMSKITGKVLDDAGKPIVGANITLDTGESVLTNETGAFEFNVAPGNYTLTVWQDGIEVDHLDFLVSSGTDVDLEAIVLGTSSNNLDVLIIGAVMAAIAGSVLMAVLFARRRRK
jgi:hypothetical protein